MAVKKPSSARARVAAQQQASASPQETPAAQDPVTQPAASAVDTKADTKVDAKADTKVDPKVDTKSEAPSSATKLQTAAASTTAAGTETAVASSAKPPAKPPVTATASPAAAAPVAAQRSGVVYAPATKAVPAADKATPPTVKTAPAVDTAESAQPESSNAKSLDDASQVLKQAADQVMHEVASTEPKSALEAASGSTPDTAAQPMPATQSQSDPAAGIKPAPTVTPTSDAVSAQAAKLVSQPVPEVKSESTLEAKPEAKPESTLEAKPEAKSESKPDSSSEEEPKLEAKSESAPEVRPEPKPEPDPDAMLPSRTPRRRVLANALRLLAVDAVEAAQSGHPGMPMGMADIAEVLWRDFMRHNPQDPSWVNRDRFILSNGHGSMLLYGLLHLTGYDLSRDDLKQFRQLDSKTPGHPEFGHTPGVETTTGPLGQGLANAVGMALSEAHLAARYNRRRCKVIDHFTYVFAGDGCLMEGISHEACSLAGTLGLGKLIVFWDNNGISIDGKVEGWFKENIPQRFAAYDWQVIADVDGHKPQAIREAIVAARADTKHPTLICCRTHIGHGAPKLADSAQVHGAPLGAEEIAAMREALKWPYSPFEIPADVEQAWDNRAHGKRLQLVWQMEWQEYQTYYPNLAAQLERLWERRFPAEWSGKMQQLLQDTQQQAPNIATRKASNQWLRQAGSILPELIVGAADVSDSVNVKWQGCQPMVPGRLQGNFIHYGVREFAMVAMATGMALHGELIPVAATYLVFSDYARAAIRMAAKRCGIFSLNQRSTLPSFEIPLLAQNTISLPKPRVPAR